MSEKEGHIVVCSQDSNSCRDIGEEFEKGKEFQIGEDDYRVWDAVVDDILDIHFYCNEYADAEILSQHILAKYSPEIVISTFEGKGYLNKKKVSYEKALEALAEKSVKADFYIKIEHGDYAGALDVISHGDVVLDESFAGVPFYEKCFFGDYGPLMEYAIDAGYHDHYCQYDEVFPFDEKGAHVLHRLIRSSDLALVEKALRLGADPGGRDRNQDTLLHHIGDYACRDEFDFDVVALIELLAKYGADINAVNQSGETPLQQLSIDHDDSPLAIAEAFIRAGARLDVFDETGAGLLANFYGNDEIKDLLLKSAPGLKPYQDDFDADVYIRKRASISDRNLPRDYDRYFVCCAESGLTDFLLQAENIEIIRSLNEEQLENIFGGIVELPGAATVLEGFYKNDLPVILEEYVEKGDELELTYETFDYRSNQAIVDFYETVPDDSYKILVSIHSPLGRIGHRRAIVDAKEEQV